MRAILFAALLFVPLAAPARPAAACATPPVPVYPGAQQVGGLAVPGLSGWVPSVGRTMWAVDEPLLAIGTGVARDRAHIGGDSACRHASGERDQEHRPGEPTRDHFPYSSSL